MWRMHTCVKEVRGTERACAHRCGGRRRRSWRRRPPTTSTPTSRACSRDLPPAPRDPRPRDPRPRDPRP
eukprot:3934492-Rhodomonas_salina.1